VHLYNIFFRTSLYIADSFVKFRTGSPKTARNEQVLRTKSRTGSKFSKTSLGLLCTWWIVVVHLYCGFLCGVRWRHSKPPNSGPYFWSFFTNFMKDSVANYGSILTLFSPSVRGLNVLYIAQKVLYFRRYMAPQRFANLRRKFSKTPKIGSRVVPNTSYSYYLHCN